MEDLPADIMIQILSRLPVKTIIHCKFVCKKWLNLVLDSSFVSLHLSKSPTGLIIHHNPANNKTDHLNFSKDPGILNWGEIEDEVDSHHFHHDPLMTLNLNLAPILQNSLIYQVGSVDGLICLRQHYPKLDNIYICNPITREFMILPGHPYYTQAYVSMIHGFGVSSLTGEYKVVRTSHWNKPRNQSYELMNVLEIEVYTLGTCQWRSLGHFPYRLREVYGSNDLFLNHHCHWIVYDTEDEVEKLSSFDLDKETFQLFPSPPHEESPIFFQSLAVLKGCLCNLHTYYMFQLTIWVMKEYGIKESWCKEVVIKQAVSPNLDWLMRGRIYLIEGLKDGSILTVRDNKLWAFNPRSEPIEDTEMFECFMSGLTYRPSFIKLGNFESERVLMF